MWAEGTASWLEQKTQASGLSRCQVAAVGDTAGDIPLLHVVGLPVFVGVPLLSELPENTRHMPAADLRDVVQLILEHSA